MNTSDRRLPVIAAHVRNGLVGTMVAVTISLALAACVATPMPDLHVDLPVAWKQEAQRTVAAAPRSDPRQWWQAFGDPQLDALVEQALSANSDIAEATARMRAARILQRHATDSLRPDLHLRTSNPIDPDASASFLVAGFD